MVFPIIVGVLIWLPTLLVINFVHGPWFSDATDVFAAFVPPLSLIVPCGIHTDRSKSAIVWAVAVAPLISVMGSITSITIEPNLFRWMYYTDKGMAADFIVAISAALVGVLLHFFLRE
jgi:hypothetical protein